MGGKGTFADGKNVPYTYEKIGEINGVKILEPLNKSSSLKLPEESHSSSSYVVLDKNGIFHQYREYNKEHLPVFEIGYHFEKGISEAGEHVFHVHEYSKPGVDNRKPARKITQAEYEKYKKFFKGVE